MFGTTFAFNQDISSWTVNNVTNMSQMFYQAHAFNQDIGSWTVSSVTNMSQMFYYAGSFNQDIGSWTVSSVTNMSQMFFNVILSTANYDSLLIGWDALELQDNVSFHGGVSKYSHGTAADARANIISTDNWTITDGGVAPFLPTVTTQAVSSITTTTATGNGNITDLGSPDPTQHGVCWNTTGNPTTGAADSHTNEGGASDIGAFASNMTGLSVGTDYYVRAYATNEAGTAYGDQVNFTTSEDGTGVPPDV